MITQEKALSEYPMCVLKNDGKDSPSHKREQRAVGNSSGLA